MERQINLRCQKDWIGLQKYNYTLSYFFCLECSRAKNHLTFLPWINVCFKYTLTFFADLQVLKSPFCKTVTPISYIFVLALFSLFFYSLVIKVVSWCWQNNFLRYRLTWFADNHWWRCLYFFEKTVTYDTYLRLPTPGLKTYLSLTPKKVSFFCIIWISTMEMFWLEVRLTLCNVENYWNEVK